MERVPEAARRSAAVAVARPRVVSGGFGQAGRVLEFVDERLEQQNDQEMSQHVRSGGALVGSGRSFQADQAFQAFEGEFNPPSQAIEGENIVCRKLLRLERSYQDQPNRRPQVFASRAGDLRAGLDGVPCDALRQPPAPAS